MFHDHQEWVIVRDDNKKLCYIALDYDLELSDEDIFSFSAPKVSVARLFVLPANFIDLKACGAQDIAFRNIMKGDVDISVNSYISVSVPSGTTMFQEISEWMTVKPTKLSKHDEDQSSWATSERLFSVQIKGSLLFSFLADADLLGGYVGSGPTIVLISCHSSTRLRNVPTVSSTCPQTETSSLLVVHVSVVRPFPKPCFGWPGLRKYRMAHFFFLAVPTWSVFLPETVALGLCSDLFLMSLTTFLHVVELSAL